MPIRFYSWPKSSGSRIHWVLEELGLDYEHVRLDRARQEHRSPAYLAVNPNGKVPALIDGEVRWFESLAILLHLGNTYGVARGLWPAPDAGQKRADAVGWTVWAVTELDRYMMDYVYHGLDTAVSYAPDQRSRGAAEHNRGMLKRLLEALETRLAEGEYLLGEFSLVDIPIAFALFFGEALGVDLGGHPHIAAWLARCRARPSLARAE